ncbi:MAG: ABC-2 transporter permease [Treponema sp.]|nr:ABC-2 transporter permease [Candidatus Treponema caballi]
MKGLLIKDLKLLGNQKKALLIAVVMFIIFMVTMDNPLFVVNYITFFGAIAALGTLSYDEFNNGLTFMFTLPVSRRQYVLEKFLFCILAGLSVWIVTVAGSCGFMFYKGTFVNPAEYLTECLTGIVIVAVMTSIMLPLQIKLGQEKARTGIFLFAGIIAVIFFVLKVWVAPTDEQMTALLAGIEGLGLAKGMLIFAGSAVVLLVVSYLISVRIINKKEY